MLGTSQKPFPWVTAIIALTAVLICGLVLHACLKTGKGVKAEVDKAIQLGNQLVDALPQIAQKFRTGTITETFRESLPEIESTGGDILELAVAEADETFTRADKRAVAWDMINLGTTVAEIKVPATFRYHLRLSDKWVLASRSNVCLVLAPPIRPSLPPAIDTAKMEKRAESGWARFDKAEKLDELERSLTGTLADRAMDPAHIRAVRDACRKSVAEFVKNWLLREDHWRTDRFSSIVVLFPEEANFASPLELQSCQSEPILRLRPGSP